MMLKSKQPKASKATQVKVDELQARHGPYETAKDAYQCARKEEAQL